MKTLLSILSVLTLAASAFSAPLTDFEVQTQSGQLWVKLVEWRDAAVAAVTASRDEATAKLAAAESDATKKLEAAEALAVIVEKADATVEEKAAARAKLDDSKTPEKTRKLRELREQKQKVQAEIDALEAKAAANKVNP